MADYNPDVQYLSAAEAAVLLDVHPATVRHAIRAGRLEAVVLYGRVLIDPAALDAYRVRTRPGGVKPAGRPPRPTGNS